MTTHSIKTNLKGLKKWAGSKSLWGFYEIDGKELTNAQVRQMIDYGIGKGYTYDSDIPMDEIRKLLNL